ncbi:hypothetical protein K443DRAFT_501856 [Laccaria amethystina LaAM-08-1]|uniref:Uncharacterized protein n=1 Tax=Laccaria amethystina LaAM-08-1 TaxID=1095629 RepID=A0A0C9XZ24_9AGAR|nr:hypothetical protein K443DRAFT_501856 [Laccaria amethystina LaAM-08-1]
MNLSNHSFVASERVGGRYLIDPRHTTSSPANHGFAQEQHSFSSHASSALSVSHDRHGLSRATTYVRNSVCRQGHLLDDPPPGQKPSQSLPILVKLAIYGSPRKSLTLQEIY